MYKFPLDFTNESVNKSGKYSITYNDTVLYQSVEFPFELIFKEYLPFYQIEVKRLECGTVKKYNLINTYSTTFTTTILDKTTKQYVPPTTITTSSTTSTTTTTTTTLGGINIQVDVDECYQSNQVVFNNIQIKFSGNNSGKYQLQIKNFTTNEIVRSFDDPVIESNIFKTTLRTGVYTFTVVDRNNQNIQYILTKEITCPTPSFSVEYIPNDCNKNNARLKVSNIKNTTSIRYCFGTSFTCSNNINQPDLSVTSQLSEGHISLNWGTSSDYVSGQFITIRGFNQTENIFYDVVVQATPCIPSIDVEYVKILTAINDLSDNFNIKVSLVNGAKRFTTPVDINISGYYSFESFVSDSMKQFPYNITVLSGSSESILNLSKSPQDYIHYVCIDTYNPIQNNNTVFLNTSPC